MLKYVLNDITFMPKQLLTPNNIHNILINYSEEKNSKLILGYYFIYENGGEY